MKVLDTLEGRVAILRQPELDRLNELCRTHEGSLTIYSEIVREFPGLDPAVPTRIEVQGGQHAS